MSLTDSVNDHFIVDPDDSEANGDEFEIIAEGLASTVSKTWASVDDGEPQLVVVKTSTTVKKWAKEPHDIIKECRVLKRLSHPNIISIIDSFLDRSQNTMNIWMPYIPYSLSSLLDSARFVPRVKDTSTQVEAHPSSFLHLTRSLMIQIIDAVTYLHAQDIAHRDLKPANVLLTSSGRVTLIDFGIAWDGSKDNVDGDLWPEGKDSKYFEVSTGSVYLYLFRSKPEPEFRSPYRAPELLFGTRSYDACAIDLWSLGAMFAEFFTSLVPVASSPTTDDFISPSFLTPLSSSNSNSSALNPLTRYTRSSLFDASRGEIGLAWSIFKILGTPREPANEQEEAKSWAWAGFKNLPDAQKVEFNRVDGVALDEQILPNLPTTGADYPDDADAVMDLIRNLLRYPPERRLKAKDIQQHPFFSSGEWLVPEDLTLDVNSGKASSGVEVNAARGTLGDLLVQTLGFA
ncbi:kinase-like domain-containing protein [Lentinula detonsa]|uniref:Kinase-like domain-containing protein n=1 Tax=Lentinula detonsa TaxID=2804962 RepID=A0A9W8P4E6_9AGAR|nr:kinase-like domain-containing protein [Lentinula detonsa]